MATLSVQEAMGLRVDREAVATLVLPQLWAMSMGPLLNVQQFERFMLVIKKLGERVEKEHDQFLRDSQRLEDRSAIGINGESSGKSHSDSIDFESLVGRAQGTAPQADATTHVKSWDEDVWGSIFNDETTLKISTPTSPGLTISSRLGSQTISTTALSRHSGAASSTSQILTPNITKAIYMEPTMRPDYLPFPPPLPPPQKVNFSVIPPKKTVEATPSTLPSQSIYTTTRQPMKSVSLVSVPPGMGSVLTPMQPSKPTLSQLSKPPSKDDWGDFDPLG